MAFKEHITVEQDKEYNYTVQFKHPGSVYVKKRITYEEAMLILGALEQGREEARREIRKALGVN
jgi:hypothetical protein